WDGTVISVFLWLILLIAALWRRRSGEVIAAVAAGCTLFFTAAMPLIAAVAHNRQVHPLLQAIEPGLQAGGDILLSDNLTQSVGFDTQRRVRIIGGGGEIPFGEITFGKN